MESWNPLFADEKTVLLDCHLERFAAWFLFKAGQI
jgi:hypothetical protein